MEVQEPVPKIRFLKYNSKIDPNIAERCDDASEDNEDLGEFTELCFFPLIVSNFKAKNQRIYARAKIVQQFPTLNIPF